MTKQQPNEKISAIEKSGHLLLNNRGANEGFECNREGCNANKTNENWSVRTGQGELANRRHPKEISSHFDSG
jgi:hypothetical protein